MKHVLRRFAVFACLTVSLQAVHASVIVNGDFENTNGWQAAGSEDGLPPGWTTTIPARNNAASIQSAPNAISGNTSAFMPNFISGDDNIRRDIVQEFGALTGDFILTVDFAAEDPGGATDRCFTVALSSPYPQQTVIACRVVDRDADGDGDVEVLNGSTYVEVPALNNSVIFDADVQVAPLIHHFALAYDDTTQRYSITITNSSAQVFTATNISVYGAGPEAGIGRIAFNTFASAGDYLIDNVGLSASGTAPAATIVDSNLLNATTNTGGDEPAGLSTNFSAVSNPGDTIEDAFGNNDGLLEPASFIFATVATPDNGNVTFGDSESTSRINWSTTTPIMLYGYRINVNSDGDPAKNRGTELVKFKVEGEEQDDLFDNNSSDGSATRLFAFPQYGNSFELGVTHKTQQGARIQEIDAVVAAPSAFLTNTVVFNAASNTGGDDPAGLSTNFTSSALTSGDTIEDAFGNNNGGVEGATLIFANGGVADNGDNIFGTGGETVDFIAWETTSPVTLLGYRVILRGDISGDAGEDSDRTTELVRFYVNGVRRDIFDANAFNGTFYRLFDVGLVTGDSFRIEFTRRTTLGGRVEEIDALVPVPPQGTVISIR